MLYNRCTGIYKFGNNTYPRRIRRRSNLDHIFRGKKCVLWAGKYGIYLFIYSFIYLTYVYTILTSAKFDLHRNFRAVTTVQDAECLYLLLSVTL